jgi:hypothetical protein
MSTILDRPLPSSRSRRHLLRALSPLERRDGMGCEEGEGVKTEEVNGTSTATLLIIRPIVILILIDYCT